MLYAVKWIGIVLVGFMSVPVLIIMFAGQDNWFSIPNALILLAQFAFWIGIYFLMAGRARKIGHTDYQAPRPDLPLEDGTKRGQMTN